MDLWIKRFSCGLSGREHAEPISDDGWTSFIAADAKTRRTRYPSTPQVAAEQIPDGAPLSVTVIDEETPGCVRVMH